MRRPTLQPESPQFTQLSKRGARRAIQRAFVLVGRDKHIRQHLREAELTTLWALEDWGLEWTVIFDHGRLEFHRGKVGKPCLTCTWRTAEDFFHWFDAPARPEGSLNCEGDAAAKRMAEPVIAAFTKCLREVLAHPVDDDGERLL
jgi:hypothetical protein